MKSYESFDGMRLVDALVWLISYCPDRDHPAFIKVRQMQAEMVAEDVEERGAILQDPEPDVARVRQCAFERCTRPAVQLVCGREHYPGPGHPVPGHYCEEHAEKVADEGTPEYLTVCPNCHCKFGVN